MSDNESLCEVKLEELSPEKLLEVARTLQVEYRKLLRSDNPLRSWQHEQLLANSPYQALVIAEPQEILEWLPDKTQLPPSVADDSRFDKLLAQLGQMNDLSVAKGLSRFDDDRLLYADMLMRFCIGVDKEIEALRAVKETNDWKNYIIRLNALNKIFTKIGHQDLSEWASELEDAARIGFFAKCEGQTGYFLGMMDNFRTRLLQTSLQDIMGEFHIKKKITARALTGKLTQLTKLCLDCDTKAVNSMALELKSSTYNAHIDVILEEICALVRSFDYEDVVARCGEVNAKLLRGENS
jgi:hypothetical protein